MCGNVVSTSYNNFYVCVCVHVSFIRGQFNRSWDNPWQCKQRQYIRFHQTSHSLFDVCARECVFVFASEWIQPTVIFKQINKKQMSCLLKKRIYTKKKRINLNPTSNRLYIYNTKSKEIWCPAKLTLMMEV